MAATIYGTMSIPFKGGGPLPTQKSNREHYAPGSGIYTRLSDNAVQIAGQGAAALAQSLRPVADGIDRLGRFALDYADMQNAKDMFAAQEAVARLQIEGQERRTALSQLKGRDAVGMDENSQSVEEKMRRWGDGARQRYSKNLGQNGLRYFNLHADQFIAGQQNWAVSHQKKEFERYRKKELEFAIDAESNNVAQDPFNEDQVAYSLGRLRGLVEQNADYNGWSQEMADAAFNAVRGAAFKKAIGSQILAGNVEGASQLLQKYGGGLDVSEAIALKKHLGSSAMQLIQEQLAGGDIASAEKTYRAMTSTYKSVTPLDEMLGSSVSDMKGTPYKMGAKEPGLGSVDCSGWVAHTLRSAGKGGYDGLNSEDQTMKAINDGRQVSLAEAKKHPRGGLVIGLDQGSKAHDKGRRVGIDHVVVTYRDRKTGNVMVSEASSSKGVHSVPFDKWVSYHESKGHKFFIGDIGDGSSSDSPVFNKAQSMGAKRAIGDAKIAQRVDSAFEKFRDNPLGGVEYYSNPDNLKKEGIPKDVGANMVEVFERKERQRLERERAENTRRIDAKLTEAYELSKTDPAAAQEMVAKDPVLPEHVKKKFIKRIHPGGIPYNASAIGDIEDEIIDGKEFDAEGYNHMVVNGIVGEKVAKRLERHQNAIQSADGQYYYSAFMALRDSIAHIKDQISPSVPTGQFEEKAKLALLKVFEDSVKNGTTEKLFDMTAEGYPVWKIIDMFSRDLIKNIPKGSGVENNTQDKKQQKTNQQNNDTQNTSKDKSKNRPERGKAYTYPARGEQITAGQRGIEAWSEEQVNLREARNARNDDVYEEY